MQTLTDGLVDFVLRTEPNDLQDNVVTYGKKLILKNLGSMIAGSVQPAGKIVSRYLKGLNCKEEAGVVGCGFRTSMDGAALANGNSGHASELEDDSFPEGCMTFNVIPAVLAVGETMNADGADVLVAFVVGYETQARLSLHALGVNRRGHSGFSVMGSLGAAAAVGKLLHLDALAMKRALSIAASHAGGLTRQHGYMAHLLECGLAARNGVIAALWAREGFSADPNILEGPHGLLEAFAGEGHSVEGLIDSLGNPFRIMDVGVKHYPNCYFQHRIIDGVKAVKESKGLRLDDIDVVEVYTAPYFRRLMRYPEPANTDEARFSIEHSIAAVFLEEELFLDSFTEERINDRRYREARRKIKSIPDPSREKDVDYLSGVDRVVIRVKSGDCYETLCEKARTDPPNYPEEKQIRDMVNKCASYAGFRPSGALDPTWEMVMNLEKVKDVAKVMRCLTFDRD